MTTLVDGFVLEAMAVGLLSAIRKGNILGGDAWVVDGACVSSSTNRCVLANESRICPGGQPRNKQKQFDTGLVGLGVIRCPL